MPGCVRLAGSTPASQAPAAMSRVRGVEQHGLVDEGADEVGLAGEGRVERDEPRGEDAGVGAWGVGGQLEGGDRLAAGAAVEAAIGAHAAVVAVAEAAAVALEVEHRGRGAVPAGRGDRGRGHDDHGGGHRGAQGRERGGEVLSGQAGHEHRGAAPGAAVGDADRRAGGDAGHVGGYAAVADGSDVLEHRRRGMAGRGRCGGVEAGGVQQVGQRLDAGDAADLAVEAAAEHGEQAAAADLEEGLLDRLAGAVGEADGGRRGEIRGGVVGAGGAEVDHRAVADEAGGHAGAVLGDRSEGERREAEVGELGRDLVVGGVRVFGVGEARDEGRRGDQLEVLEGAEREGGRLFLFAVGRDERGDEGRVEFAGGAVGVVVGRGREGDVDRREVELEAGVADPVEAIRRVREARERVLVRAAVVADHQVGQVDGLRVVGAEVGERVVEAEAVCGGRVVGGLQVDVGRERRAVRGFDSVRQQAQDGQPIAGCPEGQLAEAVGLVVFGVDDERGARARRGFILQGGRGRRVAEADHQPAVGHGGEAELAGGRVDGAAGQRIREGPVQVDAGGERGAAVGERGRREGRRRDGRGGDEAGVQVDRDEQGAGPLVRVRLSCRGGRGRGGCGGARAGRSPGTPGRWGSVAGTATGGRSRCRLRTGG